MLVQCDVAIEQQAMAPLSEAERQSVMDQALASYVAAGATVVYRDSRQAVISDQPHVNHVMHAILSLLTFGLWLLVWLLVAMTAKEKRHTITVDEFGRVGPQRPIFLRS